MGTLKAKHGLGTSGIWLGTVMCSKDQLGKSEECVTVGTIWHLNKKRPRKTRTRANFRHVTGQM